MKKVKTKLLAAAAIICVLGIYYYAALPAINIHSMDFWIFLIIIVALAAVFFAVSYVKKEELKYYGLKELKHSGVLKGLLALLLLLVIIFVIGLLISSPVVNAKKYQQLMKVETGEFATDIEELSFDQIPLLDRDSATLLGNRKMGRDRKSVV